MTNTVSKAAPAAPKTRDFAAELADLTAAHAAVQKRAEAAEARVKTLEGELQTALAEGAAARATAETASTRASNLADTLDEAAGDMLAAIRRAEAAEAQLSDLKAAGQGVEDAKASAAEAGQVLVRVLPKGHDKISTGRRVEGDEQNPAARDINHPKGAMFAASPEAAEALEAGGLVEIL